MKNHNINTIVRKNVIILILLITALTSGCSQEVKDEQNLVVAVQHGVTTLDPAFLRLLNEQYIACNLWEGLVRKDLDGSIEPGIAESWKISQDGLMYTFKLRRNALWSDGKPVTAYDFEYAWKRALDPSKDSAIVFMMYYLRNAEAYNKNKCQKDDVGVKAIDDYTLEVTLQNPTPYFLEILNYHTYYPVRQDIIEEDPNSWYRKPYMMVSNGPFCLEEWEENKQIKAKKNPHYWDRDSVKLNSIKFLIERIEDEAIWTRYTEGKIDFGYVIPKIVNIADEIASKKNNVNVDNSLTTTYLCINSKKEPFNDIRVRQALELALNRNHIVKQRERTEEVATGFVPHGIPDVEPGSDFRSMGGEYMSKEFTEENVNKAKKLLREAGYDDLSKFPTIVILTRGSILSSYIEESWENNLGINVELDVCKDVLFAQKKDNQEFDIIINSWIADLADPINFLGFLASENAFKGLLPSQYYDFVNSSTQTADNTIRIELLHEAEKTLMDSYTVIPLFFDKDAYYVQPYVKDYLKTPLAEIYFRNAYIEKKDSTKK
ncbi:peptide ABC transporter substrate-binding protein [Acetivibrio mesophilus]|uniref:Peptide ABC transporter substrate-binding protein n=1 Tax=Acetivibrio mesophilus TaxID=2487273 RepID=A0A4Q0I3J1_9FIRM|nr:peptide ABC transporter substrate-binding protein [Acetivibrio mesophilus]ODM27366.1 ABC transporter substrate-binding protein [Clostridium sp. Bc-iso-3]RXE58798.1 peptide ABC transporter substrate-binding protein [Acetivibrio mesophilus]HHV28970.1 peptide ABC transporter substrate-binding protein [Clostridium sp.]